MKLGDVKYTLVNHLYVCSTSFSAIIWFVHLSTSFFMLATIMEPKHYGIFRDSGLIQEKKWQFFEELEPSHTYCTRVIYPIKSKIINQRK